MKTNISAVKLLSMTALVCAAVLAGCADYASVGVGYTNGTTSLITHRFMPSIPSLMLGRIGCEPNDARGAFCH
jgi:hypothetical protein